MAETPLDYRRVFEGAPDAYLLLDTDLKVVQVTDRYLEATMTQRDGIIGRALFEVFPDNPDDPEATGVRNLRASLETVLRERAPHRMAIQKYDIRNPEGDGFEERFWQPINTPILDEKGRVVYIVHRVEDVTDQVRMESTKVDLVRAEEELVEAREERERFFTLPLDMLCISGNDGYFKRVSPRFAEALGWSIDELMSRPYWEFLHPDDLEATRKVVEHQIQFGESVFEFENRYRHKDGSWRTLSWRSVPQPGDIRYASARDVTALKRAQAEILSLNEGLQIRARELEAAKSEAERANAVKSDFLSRMSHELRTPLNAILGFAQLIEMSSTEANTVENVRAILKAGRHLLELINEVLDLARIEAGKLALSLEPVLLGPAISGAIDLMRPVADEREIAIFVSTGMSDRQFVLADRQRLMQVLLNLLSNAVKYNRPRGRIDVLVRTVPDDLCRVEVTDTGVGLGDDASAWLFQPFERSSNQSAPGTGLGLALSRSLMELMGGKLQVVRTSREGTTFAIDLRRAASPESEIAHVDEVGWSKNDPGERPLRLVYIEDNLSNLRLLEKVFADVGGVEMLSAMQASLGKRLVIDHKPDLVLLDLHLPDGNGMDVLRELKADPATNPIPVIVLSADATAGQISRALSSGAKAYLTKPIDLHALFAALDEVRSSRAEE